MPNGEIFPGSDSIATEHFAKLKRGGIAYLAAGPEDGPLVIMVHGWPELAISWRHQLPVLGGIGFRAIAIDLPGFGGSAVHSTHADYSMENIVGDLVEFVQSLGREKAIWVGHDWGSVVVWSLASHHPEVCNGVASLCVPYRTVEMGLDYLIETLDRNIYPEAEHPAGHWDYMKFYEQSFDKAIAAFEKDPDNFFKAFMTRGDPGMAGQPLITAGVTMRGGWFEGDGPPESEMDTAVLDKISHAQYVKAFTRNGFFGPDSLYMNSRANAEYTSRAVNNGVLDMPVLYLFASNDHWCECVKNTKFAKNMLELCPQFTSVEISAGHWLNQEKPTEVNSALTHWLATEAKIWPKRPQPNWP